MATYGVPTAVDLSADVGKFVRVNINSQLELNTAPGSASLGLLVRIYSLGATQWGEVDSGVIFHDVVAGAAFTANAQLANDATARAVPATPGGWLSRVREA